MRIVDFLAKHLPILWVRRTLAPRQQAMYLSFIHSLGRQYTGGLIVMVLTVGFESELEGTLEGALSP